MTQTLCRRDPACGVAHAVIIATAHTLLTLHLGSCWQTRHDLFLCFASGQANVFVLSYLAKLLFQKCKRQIFKDIQAESNNQISCWTVCILAVRGLTLMSLIQTTDWELFGKGFFFFVYHSTISLTTFVTLQINIKAPFIHFVQLKGQPRVKTYLFSMPLLTV